MATTTGPIQIPTMWFRTTSNRSAFTLVELLAVVAILGIMLAVALPYFSGISEGAAMEGSIRELRSTLSLARQWAITKRVKTYVVFPDNSINSVSTDRDKAYNSFNVYTKEDQYIGEWRYLKPGICFVYSQNVDPKSPAVTSNAKNIFDTKYRASVKFPAGGSSRSLPCIIFYPDGKPRLADGSELGMDAEIYLGEGKLILEGGSPKVVFPDTSPVIGVDVNALTGRIRTRDYNE